MHGAVDTPATSPDMGPIGSPGPGVEAHRSGMRKHVGGRRRIGDEARHVGIYVAVSAIQAHAVVASGDHRPAQEVEADLDAAHVPARAGISIGLIVIVDSLAEKAPPN